MGHIDHGKSTLIDYIRKTNQTLKEAGGITQSIGAYQVTVNKNKLITFIDTPGHEAFDKMRSHGAKAADIAILVVAADEGVKPQTVEAIKDIKEANLPFIVALNKMDRPEANPKKVKEELIKYEVFVEGFGGNVPVAQISAKTGKGIKELLDLIVLMAEVEEIKADTSKPASGTVIVSSLDSRQGIVATLIIKDGTLKEGQWLRLETTFGKVKAMRDFTGKLVKQAGPASPIQILGLEGLPEVGEAFHGVASQEEAQREIVPVKEEFFHDKPIVSDKVLRFILKANERASLDALGKIFAQAQTQYPDVVLQVISRGVGDVSTSDVDVADQFDAKIVGFNIKVPNIVRPIVAQKDIAIKLFTIVYDLPKVIDEIIAQTFAAKAQAAEKSELSILGVFSKSKEGQVIGGKVAKGTIKKGMAMQIKHQESVAGKGKIINLQHLKQDVVSVEAGKECGLLFSADALVEVGDTLIEI